MQTDVSCCMIVGLNYILYLISWTEQNQNDAPSQNYKIQNILK